MNEEAWTVAIMGAVATVVVVTTLACIYALSGAASNRRRF